MDELKTIRWQQRYQNLHRAFQQLQEGVNIETPSKIEVQGIIQSFEFTFELAWKTLKDYLEAQGVLCAFPREVIKQAFHHGILKDGEIWLEMLNKRNLLAHTYDEHLALEAYRLISTGYYLQIQNLMNWFAGQIDKAEIDLAQDVIALITEIAKKFQEIEKIIVFGSRVLGNAKPGSDIDLAVFGQMVTPQIVSSFHGFLEEETSIPYFFDIIHFESIENEALCEHIIRHGKILYVR